METKPTKAQTNHSTDMYSHKQVNWALYKFKTVS